MAWKSVKKNSQKAFLFFCQFVLDESMPHTRGLEYNSHI